MSEANLVQVKFEGYQIRRILDSETEEWWYAVVDVIEAITESQKPRDYWYRMKKRVLEREGFSSFRKVRVDKKDFEPQLKAINIKKTVVKPC
ncbi:MAG: hypothetical protein KDE51_01170 [Anaerolineales bacterium]|nr:hypothetical protein [Anaerolineales bacterium]